MDSRVLPVPGWCGAGVASHAPASLDTWLALESIGATLLAVATTNRAELGDLFFAHPVLLSAVLVLPPALMFSERWAHPEKWRRVRAHAEQTRVRDILAFRHIPDLRREPAG